MVTLSRSVACCAPIGMQHATKPEHVQHAAQHSTQHPEWLPYETGIDDTQHPMQRARNSDATNQPDKEAEVLRPETTEHRRWRVTIPGRAAFVVTCCPEGDHAWMVRLYPGGGVAPLPERENTRTATAAEAAELADLIARVLVNDSGAERAEALAVAMLDVDAALTCFHSLVEAQR